MLAVSALSSYDYCKRKFYIEYVLKYRTPIKKEVMLLGSLRHQAEEFGILGQESLVRNLSLANIQELEAMMRQLCSTSVERAINRHRAELVQAQIDIDETQKRIVAQMTVMATHRSRQIMDFAQAYRLEKDALWNALLPKIKPEVKVESKNLRMRGIIDQIEDHNTKILPIELKTGSAPKEGVWPSHKVQVAVYMMILNELHQIRIKEAIVRYLDAQVDRTVVLNPFLEMEIKNLIKEVYATLESPQLPAYCESRKKCDSCQYKEQCYSESFMKDLMEKRWNNKVNNTSPGSTPRQKLTNELGGTTDADLRRFF